MTYSVYELVKNKFTGNIYITKNPCEHEEILDTNIFVSKKIQYNKIADLGMLIQAALWSDIDYETIALPKRGLKILKFPDYVFITEA